MTKKMAKTLVLFATFILLAMFVLGVIQSIRLNSLMSQKSELEKAYQLTDAQYEFTKNPDYQEAFKRQEGDYGNKDDIIYN